jgi:hypothetical protein
VYIFSLNFTIRYKLSFLYKIYPREIKIMLICRFNCRSVRPKESEYFTSICLAIMPSWPSSLEHIVIVDACLGGFSPLYLQRLGLVLTAMVYFSARILCLSRSLFINMVHTHNRVHCDVVLYMGLFLDICKGVTNRMR